MADPVSKQGKRWNPDDVAPVKKMSREEKKAARIKAREAKSRSQTPESSK